MAALASWTHQRPSAKPSQAATSPRRAVRQVSAAIRVRLSVSARSPGSSLRVRSVSGSPAMTEAMDRAAGRPQAALQRASSQSDYVATSI